MRRAQAGPARPTQPLAETDARWRPAGKPRASRTALALTLGAHLLAGVLWWQERRPRPPALPELVTIQLQMPSAVRAPTLSPAPAPVPAFASARTRARRRAQADVAPARPAAPLAPPQRATAVAPPIPAPAPAPVAAPRPPPAPDAAAASATNATTDATKAANAAKALADGGSFTASLARRQAGRIDRDLRGGKSGVPLEADTPWARFQRGIEAAHIDPSSSARFDSYTSPEGVVIYRERIGSRSFCRRTGSVGLGIAGAGGVNDAGPVSCPTGVTWERAD